MTKGDEVTVVMAQSNVFPWHRNSPKFEAIYQAGPSGPGDTYRLLVDHPEGLGLTEVHLNGISPEFVGLYGEAG